MEKHLHIITHDVPWPADYGGVVDLFYKIKALHSQGVNIHLHCFHNNKKAEPILKDYCSSVNYYARKKSIASLSLTLPFIVSSRNDAQLLKNLSRDGHPVLMEGIHCTYFLKKGLLKGRKLFVRLHNVEFKYYYQLGIHENNILKKIYFFTESYLLKRYEKSIARLAVFLSVSLEDIATYKSIFHADHIHFLPVFLPWSNVSTHPGKGFFCLYHGNLRINENEKAADWLLNTVFGDMEIPLVIAGKNPSLPLQTLAHSHPNTCMVVNPSEQEMQDLISKAQLNILPSFNKTGIKLKLLNALFNGKHCLVNHAGAEGNGIEQLCHFAETSKEFQESVLQLYNKDFSQEEITKRDVALKAIFDNDKNALQLIAWIY